MGFVSFVLKLASIHKAFGHLPNIFKPQHYWAIRQGGKSVLKPSIKMHTLSSDWNRLSVRFPSLPEQLGVHLRRTNYSNWCSYYTNATVHAIARSLYAADFRLVDADVSLRAEMEQCSRPL